ncbi:MAG: type pilus assembly protein PilA [Frankiaceae bacterium]|jgi:type IV pilus assembly protein PilA|nr:type pilus assembly protein PilA [Frankiaceae bacterium]
MTATPRTDDKTRGFTLVELLVVVVLIGILAGIAIPIFLHTTNKAEDAKATSDLRNLAGVEEGYATESTTTSYGTAAELAAASQLSVSSQDTVYVYTAGVAGYCLVGHSDSSDRFLVYDSRGGGMQAPKSTLAAAQAVCTDAGYTAGGSLVSDSSGTHAS